MSPFDTLKEWIAEAHEAGVAEPTAMALATATPDGVPSVRLVLARGIDDRGIRFFTNYESRKGRELEANPRAAGVFHFPASQRQFRVEGRVVRATPEESDAYFHGRPRGSQIASAVSPQSRPIRSLDEVLAKCQQLETKLGGAEVPRPPHWGGYWILADAVEIWLGGAARLHERIRYERRGDHWEATRLGP